MKKRLLLFSIFIIFAGPLVSQTSFYKVGGPFILDTKHPDLELVNPHGGVYFINDSILVQWIAADESIGENPVSIGLSTSSPENFILMKEGIANTGSVYIQTGPDLSQYGKVNILAKDTFGLVTEKMSTDFFELIVGYTQLTFSPSHADFGAVPANSVSDTSLLVWIINKGNKNLNIDSPGSINEPFGFDFTPPSTIPPGDSLEFEITLNLDFPPGIYSDTIVFDTTSKTINQLPVSAILYASLPIVELGDDITKCAVSTITFTADASGGVPPYTYIWSTGATTPNISTGTEVDSTFIVTITDQLGLQDSDTLEVFIQQVFQGEEICIVTVDSASQKNIVVWEKTPEMGTAYYNIYKLGPTLPIGTVPYDDLSVFIDNTSNPFSQFVEYWITAVDSCGNESNPSPSHRTILLAASLGVTGNVNLQWNPYKGFNYSYFDIYRGTSINTLNKIDEVPYSPLGNFIYIDLTPPANENVYRIIVEKDNQCIPTSGKSATGEFKQSVSNISDGGQVFSFNLTVFLEGAIQSNQLMNTVLYQTGIIPLVQPFASAPWYYDQDDSVDLIPNENIVDWVLIEIRKTSGPANSATPDKMILRKAGFLLNNGEIVDLDGISDLMFDAIIPIQGEHLYAVILSRNHLSIMSGSPITWNDNLLRFEYNYTQYPNSAYIFNDWPQKLLHGKWAMIAGDGNGDGVIDISDKNHAWNAHAGESNYNSGDFNLDGNINNIDKNNFWFPNLGKGTQVPTGSAPTN